MELQNFSAILFQYSVVTTVVLSVNAHFASRLHFYFFFVIRSEAKNGEIFNVLT